MSRRRSKEFDNATEAEAMLADLLGESEANIEAELQKRRSEDALKSAEVVGKQALQQESQKWRQTEDKVEPEFHETAIDNGKGEHTATPEIKMDEPPQTTEDLRKNYGRSTESLIKKSAEDLRKNYGRSTEVKSEIYGRSTAQSTDEKSKIYGKTTEDLRKRAKNLSLLTGFQEQVFRYIFQRSKTHGSSTHNGDRISPKIGAAEIAKTVTGTDEKKVRDVIRALKEGQLFTVYSYKQGPGGWSQYLIPLSTYNQALLMETYVRSTEDLRKNYGKTTAQSTDQTTEGGPSSSSNLYLSNTTTPQNVDNSRVEWLESFDLTSLKPVGITRDTIARAFQLNPDLKQEQVEDLVWRFGEYAKDPKNRIQNARGFFLGLAKQAASGLTPLDHIETPSDRMLREYVERQKEARAQREALEKAAFDLEFEAWFETLSAEDRDQLAPSDGRVIFSGNIAQTQKLKEYFSKNIWPERRQQIEQG